MKNPQKSPLALQWQRIREWHGWTGVGVTGCLLLAACLVLGLGQNRERFGDVEGKPVAASPPLQAASVPERSITRALPPIVDPVPSPSGLLALVALEERQGKRYFRIRAVYNGPEVLIDAETGKLVDDATVGATGGGGGFSVPTSHSVVPALPPIPTLETGRE